MFDQEGTALIGSDILLTVVAVNASVLGIAFLVLWLCNRAVRPSGL
jgi:hypothetical protein